VLLPQRRITSRRSFPRIDAARRLHVVVHIRRRERTPPAAAPICAASHGRRAVRGWRACRGRRGVRTATARLRLRKPAAWAWKASSPSTVTGLIGPGAPGAPGHCARRANRGGQAPCSLAPCSPPAAGEGSKEAPPFRSARRRCRSMASFAKVHLLWVNEKSVHHCAALRSITRLKSVGGHRKLKESSFGRHERMTLREYGQVAAAKGE
jgi:hypothetical protein